MTPEIAKQKIIGEMHTMEDFEASTRDFYRKVHADPRVTDQKVRDIFQRIAEDEERHVGLVRRIIERIEKAL